MKSYIIYIKEKRKKKFPQAHAILTGDTNKFPTRHCMHAKNKSSKEIFIIHKNYYFDT